MKPIPIKWISKEDWPDAPPGIDKLLYPLNLVLDSLQTGLNKGLTFEENISSQIRQFSIKAGAAATDNIFSFASTKKTKPIGLILLNIYQEISNYTPIGQAVFLEWYFDGININVTSVTGLTSGNTYNLTVLII